MTSPSLPPPLAKRLPPDTLAALVRVDVAIRERLARVEARQDAEERHQERVDRRLRRVEDDIAQIRTTDARQDATLESGQWQAVQLQNRLRSLSPKARRNVALGSAAGIGVAVSELVRLIIHLFGG